MLVVFRKNSPLAPSVALSNGTLYVSLLLLVQRCVYCMCVFLFVCVCGGFSGGNRLWLESQRNQIYIVSVSHVEVIFRYNFDDGLWVTIMQTCVLGLSETL